MKIFRNFRVTAISKRRVGNYLLYALGEIVLVVAGILIALWFNQRNEQKKLEDETYRTARQIIKLIEKDNEEIDDILKEWTDLGKTMDTILYQTPTNEAISSSCESCGLVLTGVSLPTLSNRIPQTIRNKSLIEGPILEKLTEIEFHYIEGVDSANLFNDVVTEYVTKIVEDWQYKQPWFVEFISMGICEETCINYFYKSKDYRKKVAYYNLILIDGYYYNLIEFKKKNTFYIDQLNILLEDTTNRKII